MRALVIAILTVVLGVGGAFAQGGHIGLYPDSPTFSECSLTETLFVTNTIYIVHKFAATGNTAQFKVINNWPGPIQGAISWGSNLTLGNVYTGIAVTYVGCKVLPYVLGTLSFIPISATPPCTATLEVVADPAVSSGSVEVVDCNSVVQLATGGMIWINETQDCYCGPVGVETSNWSRIKALYQ